MPFISVLPKQESGRFDLPIALGILAADGQLAAFQHEAFWQCMDTARDVLLLDRLWSEGNAPWKIWR